MVKVINQRQDRLDAALLKFRDYTPDQHGEFVKDLDFDAAQVLADTGLIGFSITRFASGQHRIRRTSTEPLTPLGKQRVAELTGQP